MSKLLNPDNLKIGYLILIATRKFAIEKLQRKAGYGNNSRWTHIAGSLGGYTAIEANIPRSRLINLQKEYVDKGYEIKVMRRKGQEQHQRYKVALWWATMNNLPYDVLQFSCSFSGFLYPYFVVKLVLFYIICSVATKDFFALS